MKPAQPNDFDPARPRILIVDDDIELLEAFERRLWPRFDVTVARDAKEAMQQVTSHEPFAVVVADLRMPGMDGVTLLFCIRRAAPDTVGIVLTGYADLESATAAVNQGDAFRYLTKPCTPGVLVAALEASVERHREIVAGRRSLTPSLPIEEKGSVAEAATTPKLEANLEVSRRQELGIESNEIWERATAQRDRMELELRRAQQLQTVGQLADGIAHEINTPTQFVGDSIQFLADSFQSMQQLIAMYRQTLEVLTAASGQELIAQQAKEAEEAAVLAYLDKNVPAALNQAREGISQISAIASAMREFVQPGQGEKRMADLNRALEVVLTVAKSEYKLIADIETEFGEIPPVKCRLGDLNQVFLNLLINAAQAISAVVGQSGAKGRIRVRTRDEGNYVRIDVADTGCGIPDDIRDRIFEPLFATTEVGRRCGQGLAISHSIVVDEHGGSLTFESEEGKGTTFTIRFPVRRELTEPGIKGG